MDRFIDNVMPQVKGCPQALIKVELLRAAIQFCKDSWIWQQDEEKEVLEDGDTITITLETGSEIAGMQILLDGVEFIEYTRADNVVTLDDAVTSDTTFNVTSMLRPTRAATSLPDLLYNEWFEAIESKAKAELMLMPGKPWSDSQLAGINQKKYLHELGEAKIKARKVNDQTDLRVFMRPFI